LPPLVLVAALALVAIGVLAIVLAR
jgi:hypothetical protein